MGERALRVAQGLALGAVVLLLGLLVWKIAFAGDDTIAAAVAREETPAVPDVTLPNLDRGAAPVALRGYAGKALVANFWASWCIPCKDEAPILQEAWEKNRDRGLVVLGLDYNDFGEDARAFVDRYGLTFPMAVDRGKKAGTAFGITGLPETFVVDREGHVLGHLIGALDSERNRERLDELIEQALASS